MGRRLETEVTPEKILPPNTDSTCDWGVFVFESVTRKHGGVGRGWSCKQASVVRRNHRTRLFRLADI